MCPVLFRLGSLEIHTYGVCVAIGVLLSLMFMRKRAAQEALPADETVDLVLWFTVASFIGARFFYVVQQWGYYSGNLPGIFAIWEGGLIFYGGGATGLLFLWLYAKWKKRPLLNLTDFLAPYVALAHGFGRIGCFLNGCCYGKFSTVPWAVSFPALPETVHPVQLYEAGYNFLIFPLLLLLHGRKRFDGATTAMYFFLYGIGRFALEYFRGDNQPVGLGLTLPQFVSLFFIAGGLAGYAVLWGNHAFGKKTI